MLRAGAIGLIGVYQRRLSPLKGFTCAHLVLHGGVSCSQAVKLAIAEGGLLAGWRAVRARARDCRAAMIMLQIEQGGGDGQERPAGGKQRRGAGRFTGEDCCLIGAVEGCNVCFRSFSS